MAPVCSRTMSARLVARSGRIMSDSWILIEHGRVVDGRGGVPLDDTSVLIQGDHIVSVGAAASAEAVPRGEHLTTIDATGQTVMPGLIDAHCHLTYGESLTQEEQDLYTSPESRTLIAASNVSKMLSAGVTSFCEPGGSYYIGVAIRDAIQRGMIQGPRMTSAGRYLTTSNGIADFYPTSVGVPEGSVGLLTNTADEMVTAVRRHVKNGVDLIKLADSPYGEFQAFTYDEMARVTEVAHQLHRKVTIHARGAAEVGAAVRAGVDWVMHGNLMTDEVIEQLAESKIPLCPTLLLHGNWRDFGSLFGVPRRIMEGTKRMLDRSAVTLHKAHEAGVKFMLGTDTGFSATPFGEWHARELELLVEYAGLSPLEAIQAGTEGSALAVNGEGRLGVIAAGMAADVLVVDGDPAADIRVLQDRRRLSAIISRGAIWDGDKGDLGSWPVDRAQVFSTEILTYDLVHGSHEADPQRASTSDGPESARDQASQPAESELFHEVMRVTAASRER
jgi:imidazolonepropionase-like amidohydrolase